MLIGVAKRLRLFHANASWTNFYHPGPMPFYVAAVFEFVFVDTLHVLASPYAAQVAAGAALHLLAFALYLRVWLSWTGSAVFAFGSVIVAGTVSFWIIDRLFIFSFWPPFLYLADSLLVAGIIGIIAVNLRWLHDPGARLVFPHPWARKLFRPRATHVLDRCHSRRKHRPIAPGIWQDRRKRSLRFIWRHCWHIRHPDYPQHVDQLAGRNAKILRVCSPR